MLKAKLKNEQTDRLVHGIASIGLSPNTWTLLSILPALAGLLLLYCNNLLAGLIFFIISGTLDLVDGAVARATNQVTARGAFIDGVVDRYIELFLCLGLFLYLGKIDFLFLSIDIWFVLLIFGSMMTTFVRSYADHRGLVKDPIQLKKMGGLLERGERLLLLYLGMILGLHNSEWLAAVVVLVAVLANITAVQRILFSLRLSKESN